MIGDGDERHGSAADETHHARHTLLPEREGALKNPEKSQTKDGKKIRVSPPIISYSGIIAYASYLYVHTRELF